MTNYFFTADTHFDHDNIRQYCNRPWSSVGEMNEVLIQNWNSIVKKEDTIFHLGDFTLGNKNRVQKFIERLNGNIFFVKGSHDTEDWLPLRNLYIQGLKDEYGSKRLIVLCHYSMRSWEKSHYASWHLWGHSHGKLEPYGLSFDVGVDCNNYYPFNLEQVIAKMATLNPIVDFRRKIES